MNTAQKTIKTLALGFAWFLALSILVGIVGAIITVTNITTDNKNIISNQINFAEYEDQIERIEIENGVYNLEIREGDELVVDLQNVNEEFKAEIEGGNTLLIREKSNFSHNFNFFGINNLSGKGKVILYLPKNLLLEEFFIDGGLGNLTMSSISTEELIVSGGVGNVNGKDIYAKTVDVDCGAGNVEFYNVSFGDTDIDGGAGNIDLDGIFDGNIVLDSGIGNVTLSVDGAEKDYNIQIDQGIGSVRINGKKVSGEYKMNGESAGKLIDIDGGMGNIKLDFQQ